MTTDTLTIDADLEFSASVGLPPSAEFSADGFNEYGVRTNHSPESGEIDSIDVIFRAMEPGVRKNIRIKPEFLGGVAEKFSQPIPFQYDHSASQRANVGTIQQAWFSDALWLMGNIPNTGSSVRSDTIADFTHSPPAITDGSVGFGRDYDVEFNEDSDEYEFVDATLSEFSLTPFPAGYDTGGLSPAFCEAAEMAGLSVNDASHDDNEAENKAGQSRVRFSHVKITDFSNHEEN